METQWVGSTLNGEMSSGLVTLLTLVLLAGSVLGGGGGDPSPSTPLDAAPAASTSYGPVRGAILRSFSGRDFASFTGIPYAKPPLGALRFKSPQKPDKWETVFDATKTADDCVQLNHFYNQYPLSTLASNEIVGSEDCLYLNIYTPNVNPVSRYPVMVFIHGGAFMIGTGAISLQGPEILLDKDIVLVTINYRLDALGFLKLDDEIFPGNYGLKDQSLALEWVKENIHGFGGDPNSVTLFGESAGAASVHLHMLSSLSKGLFHRGISQSGTAYTTWATSPDADAIKVARDLVKSVNCDSTDMTQLAHCLRDKSAVEIIKASTAYKLFPLEIAFRPVIEKEREGSFITRKSMEQGSKLPWISGLTSGEGIIIYAEMLMAGDNNLSNFKASYKTFLPTLLSYKLSKNRDEITEKIMKNYFGETKNDLEYIQSFVNLFSDGLFYLGLNEAASKHKGELYQYLLSYVGERSFSDGVGGKNLNLGVDHGDDLIYLFNMKKMFPSLKFNKEDEKISKLLVSLWTNFAIYGHPTPEGQPINWVNSKNGKIHLVMESPDHLTLGKDLHQSRSQPLRDIFGAYMKHDEL